jgi:triosephosphate isomerase
MTATRRKLFGTWKNQVGHERSLELAAVAVECAPQCQGLFELALCPSMTALASVTDVSAGRVAVTAQNVVWDATNSFTGETSASTLSEIGCKYVILGHSERRLYLGETEEMIGRKIRTAFAHRLIPVLCVGETLDEHRDGQFEQVVLGQLSALFAAVADSASPFVVAYEPAWAISTSAEALECKPLEAGERHRFIRSALGREVGSKIADATTILYGGSVTGDNVASYFAESDIDGGLVGTASQDPNSFRALVNATIAAYRNQPACWPCRSLPTAPWEASTSTPATPTPSG